MFRRWWWPGCIEIGRDIATVPSATVAFVATSVAASAAGLAWMLVKWFTKGKPTAVGLGSGFVAGLSALPRLLIL